MLGYLLRLINRTLNVYKLYLYRFYSDFNIFRIDYLTFLFHQVGVQTKMMIAKIRILQSQQTSVNIIIKIFEDFL